MIFWKRIAFFYIPFPRSGERDFCSRIHVYWGESGGQATPLVNHCLNMVLCRYQGERRKKREERERGKEKGVEREKRENRKRIQVYWEHKGGRQLR